MRKGPVARTAFFLTRARGTPRLQLGCRSGAMLQRGPTLASPGQLSTRTLRKAAFLLFLSPGCSWRER